MSDNVYCRVQDSFGAVASIYFSNDDVHRIVYRDSNGNKFFEEEFAKFSIEIVERYAIDWALGKRELQPIL